MLFLLILTLGIYYMIKGIIVKQTQALLIITSVMFVINILVLNGIEGGFVKIFALIYLVYTFIEYLSLTYSGRTFYDLPYMSVVKIINEEVKINYKIFKPLILLPFNIYLIFKKQPLLGLKDEIGVDITAKDGTIINIKL